MLLASACHAIVIANQERSFWEMNQSDCEKVIDKLTFAFLCVMILVSLTLNIVVKNKSNVYQEFFVLLSTPIFIIKVVKVCCGLRMAFDCAS